MQYASAADTMDGFRCSLHGAHTVERGGRPGAGDLLLFAWALTFWCRRNKQPSAPGGRWRTITMHLMYFTEQPMSAYDAKAGLDFGANAADVLQQALRPGCRQPL